MEKFTHRISDLTTFELISEDNFPSTNYRKVLFFLYQPIIGARAITLYLTLKEEVDYHQFFNEKGSHQRLKLLLNCSYLKLNLSFKKLQAIGLLKAYKNKSKINSFSPNYVYFLLPPKSFHSFVNDYSLSELLFRKVPLSWKQIYESFFSKGKNEFQINGFRNITISLTEFFGNEEFGSDNLKDSLFKLKGGDSQSKKKLVSNNKYFLNNKIEKNSYATKTAPSTKVFKRAWLLGVSEKDLSMDPYLFFEQIISRKLFFNEKETISELKDITKNNNLMINTTIVYVLWKNNLRLEKNYVLKIILTLIKEKFNDINSLLLHFDLAYKFTYKSQKYNHLNPTFSKK